MSSRKIERKAREALETGVSIVHSLTKNADEELARIAPKLSSSLRRPFDKPARSFADSMKNIDQRAREERVAFLRAYKTFLENQREFVEKKIRSLEAK